MYTVIDIKNPGRKEHTKPCFQWSEKEWNQFDEDQIRKANFKLRKMVPSEDYDTLSNQIREWGIENNHHVIIEYQIIGNHYLITGFNQVECNPPLLFPFETNDLNQNVLVKCDVKSINQFWGNVLEVAKTNALLLHQDENQITPELPPEILEEIAIANVPKQFKAIATQFYRKKLSEYSDILEQKQKKPNLDNQEKLCKSKKEPSELEETHDQKPHKNKRGLGLFANRSLTIIKKIVPSRQDSKEKKEKYTP